MSQQQREPAYYNDGCVKERDYIYVSSKLRSVDPDLYDHSRLVLYKAPRWGFHDVNWNAISVCYWSYFEALVALGTKGQIRFATKQGSSEDQIADVLTVKAPVKQIREIGSKLHVCGDQGQVYRLEGHGWIHIDTGILDRKISATALDLNSIDGTAEDDIFVVGYGGEIRHFSGRSWSSIDSQTNMNLERVHCVGPGETYVCGDEGTFLRISSRGVENFSLDDEGEDFWGLSSLNGRVFVASLERIYAFNGSELEQVDTKLEPPIGSYRLDSRDGQLWSFGATDLACFDGTTWTRIIDPDNA
jgi:hypothetical protein